MPNKGWIYPGDDSSKISVSGKGEEKDGMEVLGSYCPPNSNFM